MKGSDLVRIVDQMHHEKNIAAEIIFAGIEAAMQLADREALRRGAGDAIVVTIDRDYRRNRGAQGREADRPREFGRIAAQTAKQVMIQKIREAERNSDLRRIRRAEGRPRHRHRRTRSRAAPPSSTSARPRPSCRAASRSPARRTTSASASRPSSSKSAKAGSRVKIILSRTHPDFVRRLFEQEIPEIADRTIEIKALAREAGYRTKIAVTSIDMKVDCVGACVGVRGSRIKNIVDELGGERIDIVRWNDSLQVLIPNALQPAEIEEVVPLSAAGPGDRAGQGGPAVAGDRPARPERAAGVQAGRAGTSRS